MVCITYKLRNLCKNTSVWLALNLYLHRLFSARLHTCICAFYSIRDDIRSQAPEHNAYTILQEEYFQWLLQKKWMFDLREFQLLSCLMMECFRIWERRDAPTARTLQTFNPSKQPWIATCTVADDVPGMWRVPARYLSSRAVIWRSAIVARWPSGGGARKKAGPFTRRPSTPWGPCYLNSPRLRSLAMFFPSYCD